MMKMYPNIEHFYCSSWIMLRINSKDFNFPIITFVVFDIQDRVLIVVDVSTTILIKTQMFKEDSYPMLNVTRIKRYEGEICQRVSPYD